MDLKMIKDLGYAFANLSRIVPGGIIAFFQSFSYLNKVVAIWEKAKILQRIKKTKDLFIEVKSSSSLLEQYKKAIDRNSGGVGGALLCCVYNGKMSEGINFKDDYARAVCCVGLPFPDINNLELREKMRYLDGRDNSGQQYYNNLCIRTVNQSIGRAIRWKGDFACVFLFDCRYKEDGKIIQGLSDWIQARLEHPSKFGAVISQAIQFFVKKRKK